MLIYLDETSGRLLLDILDSDDNDIIEDIRNQIKEGLKNYARKKYNC